VGYNFVVDIVGLSSFI